MFLDQVGKIISVEPKQSLLLIDVVRFSEVSSTFGYAVGDEILLEIANRITFLFQDALLGRLSGDIFGLLISGSHRCEQLNGFYDHLVEHFKTPIACRDHSFIADFNVGAVTNSANNSNFNTFFCHAESALKQAKENIYENFHHTNIVKKAMTGRSLAMKADIKRAFSQNELEIYYQPKIDLNTLQIIGAECLLRWHHPLDGLLFPGALIKAAESYNMMNEVGYWTLEEAFKGAVRLNQSGNRLKISVNMSPSQLYDINFTSKLQSLAQRYELSLSQFELELTEDVALSNSYLVKKQLAEIRGLGLSIAIDDFGKGYSNLAYMRDVKIDTIKIDKIFVMELGESSVNKAIIEATQLIAKAAGCEVVAEGIETLQHLHTLRELGVSEGQGFLFSKALPLQDFIEFSEQDLVVGGSFSRRAKAI